MRALHMGISAVLFSASAGRTAETKMAAARQHFQNMEVRDLPTCTRNWKESDFNSSGVMMRNGKFLALSALALIGTVACTTKSEEAGGTAMTDTGTANTGSAATVRTDQPGTAGPVTGGGSYTGAPTTGTTGATGTAGTGPMTDSLKGDTTTKR